MTKARTAPFDSGRIAGAVAKSPYSSRVLDSVKTEVHGDIGLLTGGTSTVQERRSWT